MNPQVIALLLATVAADITTMEPTTEVEPLTDPTPEPAILDLNPEVFVHPIPEPPIEDGQESESDNEWVEDGPGPMIEDDIDNYESEDLDNYESEDETLEEVVGSPEEIVDPRDQWISEQQDGDFQSPPEIERQV